MSKSIVIAAFTALVLIATAVLWWRSRPSATESSLNHVKATATPVPKEPQVLLDEYPQLSLRDRPRQEVIKAFNENTKRDPRYEWKIPIRFFGKVVDQDDNAVADALVHFQWVNLQGNEGVEEAEATTDQQGRFSLEGKRGKRLSVRISKKGYYDVTRDENQLDFEYANPAEHVFYEPDASNPVILRIRKKGKMEELIANEVLLDLRGQGATATVDLVTGNVSPSNGQLQVAVWKPGITAEQINTGKVFPYEWRVQLKINGGGLAEYTDVDPFEAPKSGYTSQYDALLQPTHGASADVTVDKQFYFYFGQPPKYGRFQLRTNGDRASVFIKSWLNPSGSRNLEYDAPEEDP